jgi:hypothetical protein
VVIARGLSGSGSQWREIPILRTIPSPAVFEIASDAPRSIVGFRLAAHRSHFLRKFGGPNPVGAVRNPRHGLRRWRCHRLSRGWFHGAKRCPSGEVALSPMPGEVESTKANRRSGGAILDSALRDAIVGHVGGGGGSADVSGNASRANPSLNSSRTGFETWQFLHWREASSYRTYYSGIPTHRISTLLRILSG